MNEPEEEQKEATRRELKRAVHYNREARRRMGQRSATPLWTPRPVPVPEHYHIVYHVPKAGKSIPHYQEVFLTPRDGYVRMKEMGDASEPRTEWYEDGQVGIETTLNGRSGLWWIILELARCIRSSCREHMSKEQRKANLRVVPNLTQSAEVAEHQVIKTLGSK